MLKKILIANAIFSTLNTALLLSANQMMAKFLLAADLTLFSLSASTILQILAIGLLGFAAYVATIAFTLPKFTSQTKLIIIADGLWVVSTILLFIFMSDIFTLNGMVYFGIVAIIVANFALLQSKHLKIES